MYKKLLEQLRIYQFLLLAALVWVYCLYGQIDKLQRELAQNHHQITEEIQLEEIKYE